MTPKEATYRAMKEVSGPVVAIAFVLAAVFIPVALPAVLLVSFINSSL